MTDVDLEREFVVASITRADLLSAGVSQRVVGTLTDAQMDRIARKMSDYYVDGGGGFWEDARTATDYVLKREKEESLTQQGEPGGRQTGLGLP